MLKDRSLKLDLCALALFALVVFLGVSLWTYNPQDPPGTVVWPASSSVRNACGQIGAASAHFVLEGLGYGAYYLVGSLAVLTVLLAVRRDVNQPVLRAVGWAASLVGLTTLAAMAVPNWSPGPVVGAGGYIGAMGRALLESHFAQAGTYIFAFSVTLAGLLMATDYFVFKAAAATTRVAGKTLLQVGHLGHVSPRKSKKKEKRRKANVNQRIAEGEDDYEEDDVEEEWEEAEDEGGETDDKEEREIRIRTPADKAEEAEDDLADDEEEEEDDAADEADGRGSAVTAGRTTPPTSGTASRIARGLKSALGIANGRQPAGGGAAMSERQEVIEQLDAADQEIVEELEYELPPLDLLLPNDDVCYEAHEREVRRKAKILEKTFKNFAFNVRVVEIETGPVLAQYEIELEAGLRLSRITGLADDLAIALRVPSVRIVAPVPGKNTVGIEVPNEDRQLVRLREVIEETNGRAKRMKIPIYLGKDVAGNPMVVDLAALPHLLIAGRTGTGKSVCLNSIIGSILMGRGPDEVRMLMMDPKMVELSGYAKLPHLMHPVVTDMRKAEAILAWAVDKMEERYQLLSRAGVRHVSVYNQLGEEELHERIRPESDEQWRQIPRHLPYIVIIADELADLMLVAGKDVEQHIIRLAQKSRAVGIHLILATQKPTVDVITGLIKSNLPARISFQVASRTDSRVVLDEMGAEKLLGNGDLLFLLPGTSTLLRGQGTFLSDDEISGLVDFVGTDDPQFAGELLQLKTKEELEAAGAGGFKNRDELYEAAVDIVVRERRGSVSLLQRALGIGYGRAARLIDFMAEDSIVGQYNGAQAREVLVSLEEWEARSADEPMTGGEAASAAGQSSATVLRSARASTGAVTTATVQPRRRNKIVPAPHATSDPEDELYDEEEWEDDELSDDEEDEWYEDDADEEETAEEGDDDYETDDEEWDEDEDELTDEDEDELDDVDEDELADEEEDNQWEEEDLDEDDFPTEDSEEDEYEEIAPPPRKKGRRTSRRQQV